MIIWYDMMPLELFADTLICEVVDQKPPEVTRAEFWKSKKKKRKSEVSVMHQLYHIVKTEEKHSVQITLDNVYIT